MRLTVFSDYTMRVLIFLGTRRDRLSTIGEIAAAYGISENHLMKVVHHLGQRGYVETVRGKGGGMRLALPPQEINLGRVVRDAEESLALVECFEKEHDCRIEAACMLRSVLGEALAAFFAVLDNYTLANLLQPEARLARILLQPRPAKR